MFRLKSISLFMIAILPSLCCEIAFSKDPFLAKDDVMYSNLKSKNCMTSNDNVVFKLFIPMDLITSSNYFENEPGITSRPSTPIPWDHLDDFAPPFMHNIIAT